MRREYKNKKAFRTLFKTDDKGYFRIEIMFVDTKSVYKHFFVLINWQIKF